MKRVALLAAIAIAIAAPIGGGRDAPAPAAVRAARSAGARWDAITTRLAARRVELGTRFARARGPAARAKVIADARATLVDTFGELLAPWLGMRWGLGANSTATRPHAPGMTVGCSYFVTAILEGAGVDLDNRYRFAQAPALSIQRSLVGAGRAGIHRYTSVAPAVLAREIAGLGDGVYLIGLANHVGFVVVTGAAVRLVHASYTGGRQVSDEPLASAAAIAASRPAGYFVSPVVTVAGDASDWLVRAWLTAAVVAFDPTR